MKEHEILDDDFFDKKSNQPDLISKIKQISKWWFHKRIRYNVVIVLIQVVIFGLFFNTISRRFGIGFGLTQAGAFTIVANILFSLGSIVEIIAAIFKRDLSGYRASFWLSGLWFSILLTLFMYLMSVV